MGANRRNSETSLNIRRPSTVRTPQSFVSRLSRKKSIASEDVTDTNLRRCLTTFDITLLAIGHMVGSGVYVLTATVAKNIAGPAIVVSFIFSGFASFLAALSYAELGVRYPRCGSAYSYTYLVLGELWAFLIGWSMALEHIISVASTTKTCGAYIDSLAGGVIQNATDAFTSSVHVVFPSVHMDFLAVGILLFFMTYLSFGIRMTSNLNNFFTLVNISIIVIIIGVGSYFSDLKNWTNAETGGFMPYGWSGVLAASASCFYAFVGFDSIASAGEEAKDPQTSIPRATAISMAIATVGYTGVSVVLTLMVNYKDIADDSGLPEAFSFHGAHWAKTVVIVGAISGMTTAIIGSLFALTRIIYIMADDGLLFTFCSKVSVKTKTPLIAMYIFSLISALTALMVDISTLVELLSIGTLSAYLVVSASVIIIRYRPMPVALQLNSHEFSIISENVAIKQPVADDNAGQFKERFQKLHKYTNMCPGRLVMTCVASFTLTSFILCGFTKIFFTNIAEGAWWSILIIGILLLWDILSLGTILLHQQSTTPVRFKVPLVPLVPALSILVNEILIVNLQWTTWLRLLVWASIGLCLYFSYGVYHSKLEIPALDGSNMSRPWAASDSNSTSNAHRNSEVGKIIMPTATTTQSRELLFSDPLQ